MAILLCLKDAPSDVFTANEWIADFLLFNDYKLSYDEAKEALGRDLRQGKIVIASSSTHRRRVTAGNG